MDYEELEYKKLLTDHYKKDIETIITQGRWPPPWVNEDFAIQQDEARLLTAIADNCGLSWSDANGPICAKTTAMIGMPAIGHARAVIVRCISLGYIEAKFDRAKHCIRLDATPLGMNMLELWEDENSLMMENNG